MFSEFSGQEYVINKWWLTINTFPHSGSALVLTGTWTEYTLDIGDIRKRAICNGRRVFGTKKNELIRSLVEGQEEAATKDITN